ncbi:NAD(P)/FAD-dependent oxidoreductase [Labrys monachus]|uniref:NAD/FAD-binding protein n=1 Tax=Labrys monachus TaxID=217067 RepID=A0ABU0FP39_9HYPH|nr:FAD-dependent oxidoreductase [Labrys monachus]MDQ0395805.1 putative NAD/FAD-binding protein [Labrys monachus]
MNEVVRQGGSSGKKRIAVVGSGISGLSAAWLLGKRHDVTLFEASPRPGGHSNTVQVAGADGTVPVDTGFIVYNEATYPNLTALFAHLGVATMPSDMSFAVSLDSGRLEYAGTDLAGLFAQRRNLVSPRFWSMLRDLLRFYREAPGHAAIAGDLPLGAYLDRHGYGAALREDHLYPMAAAIWSIPAARVMDYPAAAFIRFCSNHGLLKVSDRPVWRTVAGGSRVYVRALLDDFQGRIRLGTPVQRVRRVSGHVVVEPWGAAPEMFEHVVLAAHADQSLGLLADPDEDERAMLGCFSYGRNEAVLHRDPATMPRRRKVWSSWNYLSQRGEADRLSVTYWMNRLQGIDEAMPLFVTLNPTAAIEADKIICRQIYEHPIFDCRAMAAQKTLWRLQGRRRTWFAGAYFGAGFHEDGLQAGLAVAEALGGARRPWRVAEESGRIHIDAPPLPSAEEEAA